MKITSQNIDKIETIPSSDQGLVISFAGFDDADAVLLSRQLGQRVAAATIPGVRDTIPGMNNLLICYDSRLTSASTITAKALDLALGMDSHDHVGSRSWRLPVCYGGAMGPDLDEVAAATNLTPEQVIETHTAHPLSVAIMGFFPGLAYMKGVDNTLYRPRRSSPRQHVPALSLGIAMDQTVIYPLSSPGGWNLIGRVPFRPFDAARDDPVLLRPGDQVRFYAIDEAEFERLDEAAAAGQTIVMPEEGGGNDASD